MRIRHRMETRQLGNSDLHIMPVGFGSWAVGGGGWEFCQRHGKSTAELRLSEDEMARIADWLRQHP